MTSVVRVREVIRVVSQCLLRMPDFGRIHRTCQFHRGQIRGLEDVRGCATRVSVALPSQVETMCSIITTTTFCPLHQHTLYILTYAAGRLRLFTAIVTTLFADQGVSVTPAFLRITI